MDVQPVSPKVESPPVMDVQPVSPKVESPPVMDVQPVSPEVESLILSPLRRVDNFRVVRTDVRGQSRKVVLQFLKYIFETLIYLKRAYHHVFPDPPQFSVPCNNESHRQDPDHVHINLMGGQFERLIYVEMLVRTVDKIYFLRTKHGDQYLVKLSELWDTHPMEAYGVAVLNFLAGKLCKNDMHTLDNLLHLVKALSGCRKEHPPIQAHDFCSEDSIKHTLIISVIKAVLAQCEECIEITRKVERQKEILQLHLDPERWQGCMDCESVLVDTIAYTQALSTRTSAYNNSRLRMMASLRFSLHDTIDLKKANRSRAINQVEHIQRVQRFLHDFGFAKISNSMDVDADDILTVWIDYEVMFISGDQEEKRKTDLKRFLMEGLQLKERRPFFIQWKHQLLRCDPGPYRSKKCTEPQMKIILDQITRELQNVHSNPTPAEPSIKDKPKYRVHMVLEQYPCDTCKDKIVPSIKNELKRHGIPLEIISMLPYQGGCDREFLQRMTDEGGPLHPFEEKHVCLAGEAKPFNKDSQE